MLRLAALLLVLGHGAALACTAPEGLDEAWGPAARLTGAERSLVLEVAELTSADLAEYPEFWSGVRVAECDLNGDPVFEKVVLVESQYTCSLGVYVCLILVIATPPDGPRVIFEVSANELRIADTRHGGWRDLIAEIFMRPPNVARFNGTLYDFNY